LFRLDRPHGKLKKKKEEAQGENRWNNTHADRNEMRSRFVHRQIKQLLTMSVSSVPTVNDGTSNLNISANV